MTFKAPGAGQTSLPKDGDDLQASGDGFQFPKNRRKERRERRPRLRGQQNIDSTNPFRGAPPPKRYVFVSRVQKHCEEKDILDHVKRMNSELDLNVKFDLFNVECVSHCEAKFKSFCVTCSIDDFHVLMKEEMWPSDVYFSKFYLPRNGSIRKESS